MMALLMRCRGWGRNGDSFAREMKLSPALSAVLTAQSLMGCAGKGLEGVALGAPWGGDPLCRSRASQRQGSCSPRGACGDPLPTLLGLW